MTKNKDGLAGIGLLPDCCPTCNFAGLLNIETKKEDELQRYHMLLSCPLCFSFIVIVDEYNQSDNIERIVLDFIE